MATRDPEAHRGAHRPAARRRHLRRRLLVLPALALALVLPPGVRTAHAAFTAGQHFSGTYCVGTDCRPYQGYVSAAYTGSAVPLVVYLHGCTQTAAEAESYTGFDTLADTDDFIVLYPDEPYAANDPEGCWHASPAFYPGEQTRTADEPRIIVGMTQLVESNASVDPKRVFVDGASAGGNMSVVMGATYADVYAAAGVESGCQYLGNCSGTDNGPNPDGPTGTGQQAYNAGPHTHLTPVIDFQGDLDTTIYPTQSISVIEQWRDTDNLAVPSAAIPDFNHPSSVTNVAAQGNDYGYELDKWNDSSSTVQLTRYYIHGLGHAYTCSSGYAFTDPHGPCETQTAYSFFLAHPMP